MEGTSSSTQSFGTASLNIPLILLVIFLGIWIGSGLGNVRIWPRFIIVLGEIMAGMLFGVLLGYALSYHNFVGILSLGSLTVGIMIVIVADKQNKFFRLLVVVLSWATALSIYWLNWMDFTYLWELIIEDFSRAG